MKRSPAYAAGVAAALAITSAGALALAAPVALAAGPTTVSVRVEGLSRTLLPATTVRTHAGSITRYGAPKGACPATGAAGALDVATRHRWSGSYSSYGLSVTSIFGEAHSFTSKYYWSIFVDDRYASAGICELKLTRGEQLLFAAVPDKGTEYPIVLSAPGRVRAGHAFRVRASGYGAGRVLRPLAGVSVAGAVTNAKGIAMVTLRRPGHASVTASHAGWIRDEATVDVVR